MANSLKGNTRDAEVLEQSLQDLIEIFRDKNLVEKAASCMNLGNPSLARQRRLCNLYRQHQMAVSNIFHDLFSLHLERGSLPQVGPGAVLLENAKILGAMSFYEWKKQFRIDEKLFPFPRKKRGQGKRSKKNL